MIIIIIIIRNNKKLFNLKIIIKLIKKSAMKKWKKLILKW